MTLFDTAERGESTHRNAQGPGPGEYNIASLRKQNGVRFGETVAVTTDSNARSGWMRGSLDRNGLVSYRPVDEDESGPVPHSPAPPPQVQALKLRKRNNPQRKQVPQRRAGQRKPVAEDTGTPGAIYDLKGIADIPVSAPRFVQSNNREQRYQWMRAVVTAQGLSTFKPLKETVQAPPLGSAELVAAEACTQPAAQAPSLNTTGPRFETKARVYDKFSGGELGLTSPGPGFVPAALHSPCGAVIRPYHQDSPRRAMHRRRKCAEEAPGPGAYSLPDHYRNTSHNRHARKGGHPKSRMDPKKSRGRKGLDGKSEPTTEGRVGSEDMQDVATLKRSKLMQKQQQQQLKGHVGKLCSSRALMRSMLEGQRFSSLLDEVPECPRWRDRQAAVRIQAQARGRAARKHAREAIMQSAGVRRSSAIKDECQCHALRNKEILEFVARVMKQATTSPCAAPKPVGVGLEDQIQGQG